MKKAQDIELTKENLDISIVGKDTNFRKLTEKEIEKYLNNLDQGMNIDS
jgi:20S proteasome alpha/beta subunit